jgi:hypothetical protein
MLQLHQLQLLPELQHRLPLSPHAGDMPFQLLKRVLLVCRHCQLPKMRFQLPDLLLFRVLLHELHPRTAARGHPLRAGVFGWGVQLIWYLFRLQLPLLLVHRQRLYLFEL